MTTDGPVPSPPVEPSFPPTSPGRWLWKRWAVTASVWCYTGAIAAVLALLYAIGDRWWPSTFLLFGPRWLLAVPLLALGPLALAVRRRLLWPLLLTVVLLIGPILGFCVPWGRASTPGGYPCRVLTCNLNVDSTAVESIGSLAREFQPDVIAFQEVGGNARFEWLAGRNVIRRRELLVASRYPLRESRQELALHPPHRWPRISLLACIVDTPYGEVNFCNVHLPSPHFGISEVLDRSTIINPSRRATLLAETQNRQDVSRRAAQWIGQVQGPVLVVGDFNMPKESTIYRHDWSSYTDAFSQAGLGFGWTERPAIRGVPYGIRIDHILMGEGWRSSRAWVGPDVGSDHRPLLATLVRIR